MGRLALLPLLAALTSCATAGGTEAGAPPAASVSAAEVPAASAPTPTVPAPTSTAPVAPSQQATETVDFTVVGDSLTAGTASLQGAALPDENSWLPSAVGAPLNYLGGWAVPGATTEQMRDGAQPVPDAEVLVMMAGTNNVDRRGWDDTAQDLQAITADVAAETVLVSAIPPNDNAPDEVVVFNQRLRQLADGAGWRFVDPWVGVASGGTFAPGATVDGVHPTPQVAQAVGQALRAELLTLG